MSIRELALDEQTPVPSKKIVIVGGHGMLGHDIIKQISTNHTVIAPSSAECDLSNWTDVEKFFRRLKHYDIIINCAAFAKVDECESSGKKAFTVNSSGAQILAKCAEKLRIPIVHISTDYVFDGTQNLYTVSCETGPLNVYGRSKLLGEQYVRSIASRHFIVRTAWLYGSYGRNFVKTMLAAKDPSIKIVHDQFGCPTYTVDLAKAIVNVMFSENYGTHHAVGIGDCSWFDFARKIFEYAGIQKEIIPISTKKSFEIFPHIKAIRPARSVLQNTLPMKPWPEALREFIHSTL